MSRYCYVNNLKVAIHDDEFENDTVIININSLQVQPDIEQLTPNMEDNEDADSKKSELQHLGKLEYSIDYDFQKQEVISNLNNRISILNDFIFSLKLKLFKLKNCQPWI